MLFKWFVVMILFITAACVTQAVAQDSGKPGVARGVYWADAGTSTEVYLLPKRGNTYRLTVISAKEVKITYHTRINSVEPVVKDSG